MDPVNIPAKSPIQVLTRLSVEYDMNRLHYYSIVCFAFILMSVL